MLNLEMPYREYIRIFQGVYEKTRVLGMISKLEERKFYFFEEFECFKMVWG